MMTSILTPRPVWFKPKIMRSAFLDKIHACTVLSTYHVVVWPIFLDRPFWRLPAIPFPFQLLTAVSLIYSNDQLEAHQAAVHRNFEQCSGSGSKHWWIFYLKQGGWGFLGLPYQRPIAIIAPPASTPEWEVSYCQRILNYNFRKVWYTTKI